MELTKQEMVLLLQVLQQVSFSTSEGKIIAGQLQAKIEASLAESQKKTSLDSHVPDNF